MDPVHEGIENMYMYRRDRLLDLPELGQLFEMQSVVTSSLLTLLTVY